MCVSPRPKREQQLHKSDHVIQGMLPILVPACPRRESRGQVDTVYASRIAGRMKAWHGRGSETTSIIPLQPVFVAQNPACVTRPRLDREEGRHGGSGNERAQGGTGEGASNFSLSPRLHLSDQSFPARLSRKARRPRPDDPRLGGQSWGMSLL